MNALLYFKPGFMVSWKSFSGYQAKLNDDDDGGGGGDHLLIFLPDPLKCRIYYDCCYS